MENWKKIEGQHYSVSNHGRVRNDLTKEIKKNVIDTGGYYKVDLYLHGNRSTKKVHRLIAEAFIPNPDNKPQINHKDGNKLNNDLNNLEWVTAKENMEHASKFGLVSHKPTYGMKGKKNPNAGAKGNPIKLLETGEIFKNAAEAEIKTGVSDSSIIDCLHGKTKCTRVGHFVYQ